MEPIVVSRPPPLVMPKKVPVRVSLRVLIGAVIGAVFGFLGIQYALQFFAPIPGAEWLDLLPIVALPLVWLAAAGFHELGHIIGGWMGGGTFMLWMVGPVMVQRTPAGIRLAWNRSVNLTGGMAVCIPMDQAQVTPGRVAVMIAGGPLASLLLGIAILVTVSWFGGGAVSAPRAIAQNIVVLIGFMSLLVFLATAMQGAVGGFKTDGKRVFELLRGGQHSKQEAAMLVLTAAGLAGIRPADYDPTLVAAATSLRDGSLFDLYGHLTVYYHAADRREWSAAQSHLDYVMAGAEKVIPYVRDVVRCEYAWLLATQTEDIAAARAWLESAGRLDFDPATRLRAEAAVLLGEGDHSEATVKARAGLHALEHKTLSPVKSVFAVEAMEDLLQRAARESDRAQEDSNLRPSD